MSTFDEIRSPQTQGGIIVKRTAPNQVLIYSSDLRKEPFGILVTFRNDISNVSVEDLADESKLLFAENMKIKSIDVVELNGDVVDKYVVVDVGNESVSLLCCNDSWIEIKGLDMHSIISKLADVIDGDMKINKYINFILDTVRKYVNYAIDDVKGNIRCTMRPSECQSF